MTTQAQIDAAAKAMFEQNSIDFREMAKAALTAAAEVEDGLMSTAIKETKWATIERCAQVADRAKASFPADMCEKIAAAIRALKDKP